MACNDPARMLEWLRVMRPARPNPDRGDVRTTDRRLRLWACAVCRQCWDGVPCSLCGGRGLIERPVICGGNTSEADMRRIADEAGGDIPCPSCRGTGKVGGLTDPRSRRAVEVAEKYADGLATEEERAAVDRAAADTLENAGGMDVALWICSRDDERTASGHSWLWQLSGLLAERYAVPPAVQANLLRDVVGNPFRPVVVRETVPSRWPNTQYVFAPPWLTPAVTGFAAVVYEWGDWQDLPVLADLCAEHGCTDAALLDHLRGLERCPRCDSEGEVPTDDGDWGQCPNCLGTRTIPLRGPHCRGCWAVDLILGQP